MDLCVVRKFFENDFNVMLVTNKERQAKYPDAVFLRKNSKTGYNEFAIGNKEGEGIV